ncbi:hypothetical protein HDU77_000898, partial [Chytriomyces hyalinus]
RSDTSTNTTATHPFFVRAPGARQESTVSEAPSSSGSTAPNPPSQEPPADPLAALLRPKTPDGYRDLERDLWQLAKDKLRCRLTVDGVVCDSKFKNRSGCGNPTVYGVRLISIECKACEFRPRLRETCIASKFEDLIALGKLALHLDSYLRIHWNRKTAPTTKATLAQRRDDIAMQRTPGPIGSALRAVESKRPMFDHQPQGKTASNSTTTGPIVPKPPQTDSQGSADASKGADHGANRSPHVSHEAVAKVREKTQKPTKSSPPSPSPPTQPWHASTDDDAMEQDTMPGTSPALDMGLMVADMLDAIHEMQRQRAADQETIRVLTKRLLDMERSVSARIAPELPPALARSRRPSQHTGARAAAATQPRSRSRGSRAYAPSASAPPKSFIGPIDPAKSFAQVAAAAPRRKPESQAVRSIRKAQTDEELARLVTRRGAFAAGAGTSQPSRPRAATIKSCFVSTRFLRREAKQSGPIKAIRAVFKATLGLPYIDEISPLGKGFSICELFYDGEHDQAIKSKLRATELLLEDFNPLEVPAHMFDTHEETVLERFIARRAGVYRRARFELLRKATLTGVDEATQRRILELAKGSAKQRA